MKCFLLGAIVVLSGCGPGLEYHPVGPPDAMLGRASLVFVGVIQDHEFESWPFFRFHRTGDDPEMAKYWKILRRDVRVELVLRGVEARRVVGVYEIYYTGGRSGVWNVTQNGERNLFLVRPENGRLHVVGDWNRSIFPVESGYHSSLPLDDSHPLWERIALMNWWFGTANQSARVSIFPGFSYTDPGGALGLWRMVKLERGLVRHPSRSIRVSACGGLLTLGPGYDECWEMLSDNDKAQLGETCGVCSASKIAKNRQFLHEHDAAWWWSYPPQRENRQLLTTVNDRKLRTEFCRFYEREYPGDHDSGCPADRPPPATIVTERGDVPLVGPWPR
jgi:hypothetical protein